MEDPQLLLFCHSHTKKDGCKCRNRVSFRHSNVYCHIHARMFINQYGADPYVEFN